MLSAVIPSASSLFPNPSAPLSEKSLRIEMAFSLPDTDSNLLFQAMRTCWKDGSDQIFEAFFGLFKQLIQAEFARYTSEIALVDQLCAAARDEIRREFSHQEEKNFDYLLLFRAIVYSHFSHTLKGPAV